MLQYTYIYVCVAFEKHKQTNSHGTMICAQDYKLNQKQ